MARKAKVDNSILKRIKNAKSSTRILNKLPERKYYLIFTEGEKTEPNYFEKFKEQLPKNSVSIEILGAGDNTLSLLNQTISKKKKFAEANNFEYDSVWIVFDKDSFPADDFDNTIHKAKENKVKCAYSNEAFELWYLLHFHYYQDACNRNDYKNRLTSCLNEEYKKNSIEMYAMLLDRQKKAIDNAKKLFKIKKYLPYSKRNPCTTVFLLVEELNNLIYQHNDK